ncbi:MAG: SDR family NAD(P)-dependent oxidoreductase, partial [Thermodesulfobacteriota bacterium]
MGESQCKPAREGVFWGLESEAPLPLALVFPGQGSCYASMGRELYESIPVFRQWLDRIAQGAEFDVLKLLFLADEATTLDTRWQQPALFAIETAMVQSFLSLGVCPQALAGHSVGELSALCAAEVFSWGDGIRIVRKRAELMDRVGRSIEDPGVMMAVDAPIGVLEEKISGNEQMFFTNFNSPNQVVVGGSTESLSELARELEKNGYRCTRLKVSMAFHSPALNTIRDELKNFLSNIEFQAPRIPVISNTNNTFFPDDSEEIRSILVSQIERPVHWMQNIRKLWNDAGIRCFLEVGPGGALSDLIADTLDGAVCVETCRSDREVHTYRTALARLYASGNLRDGIRPDELNVSQETMLRSSAAAGEKDSSPGFGEGAEATGYLEQVIRIIMEATGYERHEIEPDMDLREDLAIRSSRLPVIVDMAERRFGITVNLKDFVGVHTVRQVADRIEEVALRDGSEPRVHEDTENPPLAPVRNLATRRPEETVEIERGPIQRFVFEEAPLKRGSGRALEIGLGRAVVLLNASRTSVLAEALARVLSEKYQVRPVIMNCWGPSERGNAFDLRTTGGVESAGAFLAQTEGLAGLTLVLDGEASGIGDLHEVPAFLAGFFTTVQRLLHSPHKVFCSLVHRKTDPRASSDVAAEGVLGLFLAARQEYSSVLFRGIETDRRTEAEDIVRLALDTGMDEVQVICRDRELFTPRPRVQDAALSEAPDFTLNRGDVVVVSGGGKGITAWLARALAPFGPRLLLLGRTRLDASIDYDALLAMEGPIESAVRTYLKEHRPEAAKTGLDAELGKIMAGAEVRETILDLRSRGMEVEYHCCDVTREESVSSVLEGAVRRYGRIDGIIHGAGILRDSFMEFMTREDFLRVMDVKLTGAWNLYNAAGSHGLRFMVGLSSIVAALGNIGQTNYCSANRAMGALLRALPGEAEGVATKTLLMPPIDGAGMAGDAEIKALMKLRGMADAYVHVKELMELFCREMFAVSGGPSEVMWSRPLPKSISRGFHMNKTPPMEGLGLSSGGNAFPFEKFPLVDSVRRLDLEKGELETERNFNVDRDLWLEDHRPFESAKHPLISGVMIVETLMEAAKLLYPYLRIYGLRNVEFRDMVECLPDT